MPGEIYSSGRSNPWDSSDRRIGNDLQLGSKSSCTDSDSDASSNPKMPGAWEDSQSDSEDYSSVDSDGDNKVVEDQYAILLDPKKRIIVILDIWQNANSLDRFRELTGLSWEERLSSPCKDKLYYLWHRKTKMSSWPVHKVFEFSSLYMSIYETHSSD